MNCIIIAGGKGARLAPLMADVPKSMVPINGKPLLDYQLAWLRKHGINNIVLAVCHQREIIENHLGDGKRFGVNIKYAVEDKDHPLGTAGCVKAAAKYLDDPFLVFYGDNITNLDLTGMLQFHKARKSFVTLYAYRQELSDERTTPGVVVSDTEGRIQQMIERPNEAEQKWIATIPAEQRLTNSGIYLVEKAALEFIPEGASDFARDIFPRILKTKPMHVFRNPCYIREIGQPMRYLRAKEEIESGKITLS